MGETDRGIKGADSIASLTSLRFFAALYVLVFHSGAGFVGKAMPALGFLETFFGNGYLGVTFFFVLSGFILAHVYDGKLRSRSDLGRFAMARFARIYPVYLLALLLVLPLILKDPSWRSLPQFFLLQYWTPLADLRALDNTNFPGWSLSVEMAFYILFPPVLWGFSRLGPRGLVLATLSACALMLAFRLPSLNVDVAPPVAWLNHVPFMLLRAPEFIFGAGLGLLYHRQPTLFRSNWLTAVTIAAILTVLVTVASPWAAPIATTLFGVLIAAVSVNRDSLVARILSNRLLLLGGGASYSLYILQMPVRYWIGQIVTGDLALAGRALYAPSLVLISVLVFLYFEEPVREQLRKRAKLAPSQGERVAEAVTGTSSTDTAERLPLQ
jgi:peptidoglycan/LPS O-acetylase OafA/YrhL